ncbi:MAG: acetate/propionate family kinase [Clostridiaceae bacterium]
MKILVINSGSSSLKYQLIDMENENILAKGLVERIGIDGSILTQKVDGREKYIVKMPMNDHVVAIDLVLKTLVDKTNGVITALSEISAVGHRFLHGATKYLSTVIVNDEVMKGLNECRSLGPLHIPANISGIEACLKLMPNTPNAVVFDTAFHSTIPDYANIYPLPYELYEKHGIRKYGFHGTSHQYVSRETAKMMGKDIKDLKIITCHLGNGASLTAVKGGKSIETSMGFTPLEGIAMGTRCGSIDPQIIVYLEEELGYSSEEVSEILNKKSGVYGISGVSSDFRDIFKAAEEGNKRAQLACDVFHYKVIKFIGSYTAVMGGVDAITFTAGLGENEPITREDVCRRLAFMGIKIDLEKNKVRGKATELSTPESKVKIFTIPTNEELMIARETKDLL